MLTGSRRGRLSSVMIVPSLPGRATAGVRHAGLATLAWSCTWLRGRTSQGRRSTLHPAAAALAGLGFPVIITPAVPRAVRALTLPLPACVAQADCRAARPVGDLHG